VSRSTPAPAEGDPEREAVWVRGRVHRARRGDREAFGDLYRRYGRLVHGILLARLPPGETQDLVQEVFLLALRKLGTLRDPGAFAPWLATLARRAAADHLREGRSRPERPTDDPPAPPGCLPTAESGSQEDV